MNNSSQNPEEAFLHRIQNYVTNLEFSNSELENQLQVLRKDLLNSHTISQQLQSQNVGILDKSQELESRKRLLDTFLELRNQEKEIYIKNIELFLGRLQKINGKEEDFALNLEKSRNESIYLRSRLEELELENQQLKEANKMKDILFDREKEFLKNQIQGYESDLNREKERNHEFLRKTAANHQEIEALKSKERVFLEEKQDFQGRMHGLDENIKRLEILMIAKNEELESLRRNTERVIGKYEEDLKPFIEGFQRLKEENELKNGLLENAKKEILDNKLEKAKIQEESEKKIEDLVEELRVFKEDQSFLIGIAGLSNESLKNLDLLSVINKLQKGYLMERNRALNNGQIVRNLKHGIEKKYQVLFEKYEEWKEFKNNYEELKKGYEIQRKKIRDLTQERDLSRFEIKEIMRKNKGLESEKKELLRAIEKILEKSEFSSKMRELIEKNLEMQRKLEEIYEDSYASL